MHLGRIVPKLTLQQADRIDRLELGIIVPGLELTCVDFTSVEHDPLDEPRMRRQLHLDVVDRTPLVDGSNVEDRQFVVLEILQVVRVLDRHIGNRNREGQDRVEQADQSHLVLGGPKGFLECEIVGRTDTNRLHLAISLLSQEMFFRECITPIFGARTRIPQTLPRLVRSFVSLAFASLAPRRERLFRRGPGSCPRACVSPQRRKGRKGKQLRPSCAWHQFFHQEPLKEPPRALPTICTATKQHAPTLGITYGLVSKTLAATSKRLRHLRCRRPERHVG